MILVGVQSKKIFGSLYEPILMCTKSKKSKYTFNYQDILVETKTGAKRKLIDYRKKYRHHIIRQKYLEMYGILIE